MSRARYAWWRRDLVKLAEVRGTLKDAQAVFAPGLMPEFMTVFLEDKWLERREGLVRLAYELPPVRRRRAFVGQMISEAAAYNGDIQTALAMLEFSISNGLIDLHWMDKCPLFDDVRADPGFKPLRAIVKQRADGVLDALYGDHHLGTSETAVAPSIG